ncbi:ThiF family adenylyltransferase [Rhodococcus qingshengii]|uniref:ThiF family adenylyltransferase n=1 Tax=Rhodococcus qingshengii TaxID=334542 RepID=UPI0027E227E2|nr:ThiF family adenylyltransferase [Rhodococcus qingshengii]
MSSVDIIEHRGEYKDDFYWERVNRNLGWLGETDDEAEKRQATLRDSVIGVAGAGGIGGSTVLRLIRMGVGKIKVADNDEFDTTNIQRQVGADTTHLGQN